MKPQLPVTTDPNRHEEQIGYEQAGRWTVLRYHAASDLKDLQEAK